MKNKDIISRILYSTDISNIETYETDDKDTVEVVRDLEEISKNLFDVDKALSIFYKSEKEEKGSKFILINENLKKLFNKTEDSAIKNRVLSKKVKTDYIVRKNNNFIELVEENDKAEVKSIGYNSAKKALINAKKVYALSTYSVRNLLAKYRITGQYKKIRILTEITEQRARIIESNGKRMVICNLVELIPRKPGNPNPHTISKIIVESAEKTKINLSSAINSTFDLQEKVQQALLKTDIEEYQTVNPQTGFIATKTRRIVSEKYKDESEYIKRKIKDGQDLNIFFEKISDEIKLININLEKANDCETVLISGDEVVSAYNVSSYFKSGYNYRENFTKSIDELNIETQFNGVDFGPLTGGSLYGSCMRYDTNINQIKFYAKNPKLVALLVNRTKETKEVKARAVVWIDRENEKYYVDRIFFYDDKSLLSIVNFINSTDNFFSVSEYNKGVNQKKGLGEFLIKFEELEYKTQNNPYFDTMYHNTFIDRNGIEYIGRCNSKHVIQTEKIFYRDSGSNIQIEEPIAKCDITNKIIDKGFLIDGIRVGVDGARIVKIENGPVCLEFNQNGHRIIKPISKNEKLEDGKYYMSSSDKESVTKIIKEDYVIKIGSKDEVIGLDIYGESKFRIEDGCEGKVLNYRGASTGRYIIEENYIKLEIENKTVFIEKDILNTMGPDYVSKIIMSDVNKKRATIKLKELSEDILYQISTENFTWRESAKDQLVKLIKEKKGVIEGCEIIRPKRSSHKNKVSFTFVYERDAFLLRVDKDKVKDVDFNSEKTEEIKQILTNGYTAIKEAC